MKDRVVAALTLLLTVGVLGSSYSYSSTTSLNKPETYQGAISETRSSSHPAVDGDDALSTSAAPENGRLVASSQVRAAGHHSGKVAKHKSAVAQHAPAVSHKSPAANHRHSITTRKPASAPGRLSTAVSKPASTIHHRLPSDTGLSTKMWPRPDKIASMEQPVAHSDEAEKSGLSVGSALSTVFKLLIVLGLAYITVLGLKWLSSKKVPLPQNTRDLKLMETLRLSPSNTLHVVNTRGKSFLVGCTSGQLSILTELDPAEDTVPAENSGSGFAEYLAKYSDGHANKGGASRMAGLLRDCTEYLQTRTIKSRAQTGGGDEA